MNFELAEHSVESGILIINIMKGLYEKGFPDITEIKVQKLAYMVYGFYLSATGKRIVRELPSAIPSGPVFLDAHREIFISPNGTFKYFFSNKDNIDNVEDKKLKQIITDVIDVYGKWDSKKLIAWAFLKDSPRTKTREEKCLENKYSDNIDDELTYEYFLDQTNQNKIKINKRLDSQDIIDMYDKIRNNTSIIRGREGTNIPIVGNQRESEKNKTAQVLLKNENYSKEVLNTDIDEYEKKIKENEFEEGKKKNEYRSKFVERVIRLTSIFLFVTGCIIIFDTALSDSVKIAILSSTTATIIGLPLVIVKGLFESKDKKGKK